MENTYQHLFLIFIYFCSIYFVLKSTRKHIQFEFKKLGLEIHSKNIVIASEIKRHVDDKFMEVERERIRQENIRKASNSVTTVRKPRRKKEEK